MERLEHYTAKVKNSSNTPLYDRLNAIQKAWTELLSPVFPDPGSWYVTMTFRDTVRDWDGQAITVHPETAHKCWMRLIHKLNREIHGSNYWKRGQGVIWARATEYQQRGAVHYHALVGNIPARVRRMDYVNYCYENYGIARIHKYDKGKGAVSYLAKTAYLWKKGEIDLSATIRKPDTDQFRLL